jgi:hypothetical protein
VFIETISLKRSIDYSSTTSFEPSSMRRRNAQKGVDLTEAGDGALSATRVRVVTEGNPDD